MKTKKFKCTLLSDIILSEHSATDGIQRTLDYIPGNVFLGIVAGKLYPKDKNDNHRLLDAMDLFHNAKVRFGDAHPLLNDKRAIRVPASWHTRKGDSLQNQVYNHHDLPDAGLKDENGKPQQVKQCRGEFIYKTGENHFSIIEQEKNFTIKSAHNKETRRSRDQQMYGYQSLEEGTSYCFQVDFCDSIPDDLIKEVINTLLNNPALGRSRTAQYGQVKIEEEDFEPSFEENKIISNACTFLYAESRLLFLDDAGQPTASPTGDQLGVPDAEIDLHKSQIRTFRYAPYNGKRQSRDADRYGIEKGSVICLKRAITSNEISKIQKGLGLYLNEGFGKVLINPEFLLSADQYGATVFSYKDIKSEDDDKSVNQEINESLKNDLVFKYLKKAKEVKEEETEMLKLVNDFVETYKGIYQKDGESFSSQWGTVRVKAMQARDKVTLGTALFSEEEDNEGYLVRGIAASKWEGKPIRVFKEFFDKENVTTKTIVNLAAQMAKVCQQKGGAL